MVYKNKVTENISSITFDKCTLDKFRCILNNHIEEALARGYTNLSIETRADSPNNVWIELTGDRLETDRELKERLAL